MIFSDFSPRMLKPRMINVRPLSTPFIFCEYLTLLLTWPFTCSTATGADPRRLEAREYNVGGAGAAAVPSQGHRLRQRIARQQGCLQHVSAESLLQVTLSLFTRRTCIDL